MNTDVANEIRNIKRSIVSTAKYCKSNHIPSSLSCLEILYTLYSRVANITNLNKSDLLRDRVILSKEHARLGQVCVLAELGLLSKELLNEWQQNDGRLGHDIFNYVSDEDLASIDISSSSLGQGIGIGIGIALGDPNHHVYVIVGDGELQEGSCWEALMFIGQHQLKNITIIIDRNNVQILGLTKNIIDTSSNLVEQIGAFHFDCIECNGHDVKEIELALKKETIQSKCVICDTIKAKEVQFLIEEKGYSYIHGWVYENSEFDKILEEIK